MARSPKSVVRLRDGARVHVVAQRAVISTEEQITETITAAVNAFIHGYGSLE